MEVEPLLTELLMARGPGGQEDEVRSICLRELTAFCDDLKVDRAGNVIGLIKAAHDSDPGEAIRVMAHLDEIAMIVKTVEADGTLKVVALGGAQPICFGACPVDMLGDRTTLPGVLSYGSMHNSGSCQHCDRHRWPFQQLNPIFHQSIPDRFHKPRSIFRRSSRL